MNLLAANLTTQVRAIADVATAVTKGDLTREIQVDARGEVVVLKDNINAMIQNLRATTEQNTEQDWLKSNLAKFTTMLQGQRDLTTVGQMLLSELAPLVNAQCGAIYQMDSGNGQPHLAMLAGYARAMSQDEHARLALGDGLVGQCALDKTPNFDLGYPDGLRAHQFESRRRATTQPDCAARSYSKARPKPSSSSPPCRNLLRPISPFSRN